MPLPRLPFPNFYTGSQYKGRSIVDPKEFWANVLHLARLINGGLGVENLAYSAGIAPTNLERPKSSTLLFFDFDTRNGFAGREVLFQTPVELWLVGASAPSSGASSGWPTGDIAVTSDPVHSAGTITLHVLGNTPSNSPNVKHVAANSYLTFAVSNGWFLGLTLEVILGHTS